MKKRWVATGVALAIGFLSAVGLCVKTLCAPKTVAATENTLRIVLDAGHGGMDGGVVGRKSKAKESDVNLAIVYRLKNELEDVGFEVTLTRKTEAGLYGTATKGFKKRDMQKRKEIIQAAEPALIISIHQNFYSSKRTRGGQVFYLENSVEGEKFALSVQEELNELYEKKGVRSRKATKGDFFILKCYDCPSAIVECGFLSNAEDEVLLLDEVWQSELAKGITSGVLGYFANLSA